VIEKEVNPILRGDGPRFASSSEHSGIHQVTHLNISKPLNGAIDKEHGIF